MTRAALFRYGSIFIVVLAAYGAYAYAKGNERVIEIRDGGFVPSELTIQAGDTITFKNVRTIDAWPASDPHPTHEYLKGFDPGKAILPGGEWSITFATSGSFRFHDHLDVTAQGRIIVRGVVPTPPDECDQACFDELIRHVVETQGVDAAYQVFQDAFASGKLPAGCHWTAHVIGEAAYEQFKETNDVPISEATTYCGFGFYHGFLEGLLREFNDPAYALEFCKRVEKRLGTLGLQNCYHGIGHGYTEDPPDPSVVGDFQAMIDPGIKMCEFLFGKNFTYLNLCLTGVFTVPAGFALEGKYGLSIDPKEPFAYCKGQPYRYLKACYGEFAPKLNAILDYDLSRLPPYVDAIQDEKLKRLVTWVVPSVIMAEDILDKDHSQYIEKCRKGFSGNLRHICWGGSILGFFLQGEPEKEYQPILRFCLSKSWQSEEERRFCWGEAFRQMQQHYSKEKMAGICREIPDRYHALCFDENDTHDSPYDDPSFETP